ncbi:hypothetical protein ACHAWU_001713 [Discostella pseudostelligera]|uniref:DUF1995 domain-containing protein n=1 Tax=Discostella pseudostelligera TaxID=259834 RepID=A0ABD3M8B9_9STRA
MRIHRLILHVTSFAVVLSLSNTCNCNAFVTPSTNARRRTSLPMFGSASTNKSNLQPSTSSSLTPLPRGISPFEKSLSKNIDVQADFRQKAKRAIDSAIRDGVTKIEIEFPPLIGGSQSKSQFDDFDNIQELDKNKDWTMLLAPMFLGDSYYQKGKTWLIFPDLKECEIAKKEWAGKRYQEATFTTIEAVTNFVSAGSKNSDGASAATTSGYDAPWGSSFVSGLSKIMGGEKGDAGLLGDQAALDPILEGENFPATLWLVIQPGNGGPVEDWVNCEKMSFAQPNTPVVIINGALDKVRGGFYPAVFFPKLAATVDRFYKKFESAFYLKPFSDKGVYGWLYRVYPEPWQVVLENVKPGKDGNPVVEYVTVAVLDKRPMYSEVVSMLVKASQGNK